MKRKDNLGERIKTLRKEKGMTQMELASKLHLTDKAVSKWELGEGSPDISLLPELASIFSVSVDYLLTGKKEEKQIVYMSRIERAAKEDDPSLLEGLDFSCGHVATDETGHSALDYIKQHESLKTLNKVVDICASRHDYEIFRLSNILDFDLLVLLIRIGRENETVGIKRIVAISNFESEDLWRQVGVTKGKISKGYMKIFSCLIENFDSLTDEQKKLYFNNGVGPFFKDEAWTSAYPYLIDIAYGEKRPVFDKLITQVNANHDMWAQGKGERSIGPCQIGREYPRVRPLQETLERAIAGEDTDNARLLNSFMEKPIKDYDLERKLYLSDPKRSEHDKAVYSCMYYGVLCLDEAKKIGDPKLAIKLINENPIHPYELFKPLYEKKDYKSIFRLAVDNDCRELAFAALEKDDPKILKGILYPSGKLTEMPTNGVRARQNGIYHDQNRYKREIDESLVERRKETIQEIKLADSKRRMSGNIDADYLWGQFEEGNYEALVSALCKKLEAYLRYTKRYEGKFDDILDKYIGTFNTTDDEDNNYDPETPRLLESLREARYSLVDDDNSYEPMSKGELEDLIRHIERM